MRFTLHSMQRHPFRWLLLGGLALAACIEGRDETQVRPPSASSAGASGAAGEATSGGNGAGGAVGQGGSGVEIRDASGDAAPDALAPERACGSLESYCRGNPTAVIARCPDLSSAPHALRQAGGSIIVQRPCRAADGSPRVSVSVSYEALYSNSFVYDPATGEVVGAEAIDDVNQACFGEVSRDCSSKWPDNGFLAGCDRLDAGSLEGFGDAALYACDLADAGLAP